MHLRPVWGAYRRTPTRRLVHEIVEGALRLSVRRRCAVDCADDGAQLAPAAELDSDLCGALLLCSGPRSQPLPPRRYHLAGGTAATCGQRTLSAITSKSRQVERKAHVPIIVWPQRPSPCTVTAACLDVVFLCVSLCPPALLPSRVHCAARDPIELPHSNPVCRSRLLPQAVTAASPLLSSVTVLVRRSFSDSSCCSGQGVRTQLVVSPTRRHSRCTAGTAPSRWPRPCPGW